MDQNDPARQPFAQPSRNVTPSQHVQPGSQHLLQSQQSFNPSVAQFAANQSPSGFRAHQTAVANPALGSSGERAGPDHQNLYFSQGLQYGSTQSGSSQYAAGLGAREEIKPHTQQQAGFGSSFVYGMQPGLSQHHMQQVAFDQSEQARHRAQASAETLPSQYEEAQATQYYSGMQPGSSTTSTNTYGDSQYVQQYANPTYSTPAQSTSLSSMPNTMIQSLQQPTYSSPQSQQQQQQYFAFQQPAQQQHSQQGQHQPVQQPQQQQQLSASNLADAVSQYQTAVRTIFTQIRARSLQNVQQLLVDITRFLIANVAQLGLTHDSEGRNDENNLKFWDEFNRAWLTALQCQFDSAQGAITGRQSIDSVHLFDRPTLERLGEELIALCDKLERHGLVDYQMGVAEDEIMEHILRCLTQLQQLEPSSDGQATAGAGQETESAR